MTINENCREVENMRTGVARSAGVFISGVWDKKTGKIASMAMLEATTGYKDCCSKKNKEEEAISLNQLLDSNNIRRPSGDIRAHFRHMKHHDPVPVKSLIQGNYAKSPKAKVHFGHQDCHG